jgi:hypothetical protein
MMATKLPQRRKKEEGARKSDDSDGAEFARQNAPALFRLASNHSLQRARVLHLIHLNCTAYFMSDAQLIAEMRRIIHGAADKLEELSVKSVRLALETKFQCDLSSRKEFVRAEVEKAVSALDAPEAPSSKPTAAPKVATKSDKVSETAVKPRRVVESTTTAVSAVEQERLAERARLKAAAVRSGMVSMQKQNAVPANVLAETSKANVKGSTCLVIFVSQFGFN